MSRSTISTFKLFELFPDEPSARKYLEGRLWKDGVVCPECKSKDRITVRKDGFYRCNACKLDFTVRTGTIFERSHVPLHKRLYATFNAPASGRKVSPASWVLALSNIRKAIFTALVTLGRVPLRPDERQLAPSCDGHRVRPGTCWYYEKLGTYILDSLK